MNMVHELRIKKGIQAKQLALEIGVSPATVSDWEHGRKNPTGARLKKLAEYFKVDEGFILGYGMENPNLFVPENPKISGISETEQIVQHVLERLRPKTPQIKIVSGWMEKMPQEDQDRVVEMMQLMFRDHPELLKREDDVHDTNA